MVRRRKDEDFDSISEMRRLLDSTFSCFCPECGAECVVDFIDYGNKIDPHTVEFTCDECGHFIADHDIRKGEWKLRDSDMLYLPNYEGNEFTLYQRFDETSYPTRQKALEEKYRIMEGLVQPLLDNRSFEYFEKFNRDLIACCRELSDMGIAKYKGILARFLLTSNADERNPTTPLGAELRDEIETLIQETDYEGLSEAIFSAVAYECSGLESGINISTWADMLVDRCLSESEGLDDSEKVRFYLRACLHLITVGDVMRSHRLTSMAIDLIKKNISTIPDADDMLAEAYSYTDPSLNSFEMSKEIYEHSRAHAAARPEQFACSLLEMCVRSEDHPEERKQALEELDRYINTVIDDPDANPSILMRAYYTRYQIIGNTTDLQNAFNTAVESDMFGVGRFNITVIKEYLGSIRNNRRRLDQALRKLGMQGMSCDEAIEVLTSLVRGMTPRFC